MKKLIRRGGIRRIYLLPNLLTTGNIICGVLSVIYTIDGRYQAAAYAILIGWLFDLLDGRIARLTNTGSLFGVHYDSLADLVTFGLAPGALIFQYFKRPHDKFLVAVVVIYTVSCALRLARFNLQASTTEKHGFKGLPSPASGCLIATLFLCLLLTAGGSPAPESRLLALSIQVLALLLSGLMVSDIPYPALDPSILRRRHPFHYLVILLISVAFIVSNPPLALWILFTGYTLSGPVFMLFRYLRHQVPAEEPPEETGEALHPKE